MSNIDIKKILNSGTINVSELLKTCEISPSKWADVKRDKSSFTPDEIERIENRIKELSLMSNGMATQFFQFISQPEINISKLLKDRGIDKRVYDALIHTKNNLPDLMVAMMQWQEGVNPERGETIKNKYT